MKAFFRAMYRAMVIGALSTALPADQYPDVFAGVGTAVVVVLFFIEMYWAKTARDVVENGQGVLGR